MQISERILLIAAGAAGATGVAFHALAAHSASIDNVAWLQTSATFLLFHASALIALFAAARISHAPRRLLVAGGLIMIVGLALFSGDLAFRTFTGAEHLFPNATPIGGGLLMLAWALVLLSALALPRR